MVVDLRWYEQDYFDPYSTTREETANDVQVDEEENRIDEEK